MLCVKSKKWTNGQCTKWKVTSVLPEGFAYKRCKMMMKNEMPLERLNDDLDTVKRFCYLGNVLNTSGGSEMKKKNWMDEI